MRRSVYRRKATGLSLFPFLAVLICTMGALIVLLILVVQEAAVQAELIRNRRETKAQPAEERRLQLEDQDWRREILQQLRAEQLEELSRQRLELSHLEEHIRSLEDEARRLQAAAAELQRDDTASEHDLAAARNELASIQTAIEDARRQLDEARKRAANRPSSYALIPYDGPNGTRRRPIYVECTSRGIVLQPEGVVLQIGDLNGPLGPGNPLDAALRAIREHLAARGGVEVHGEPYPLLIVRPDGAETYGMARAAMKDWDDEFGYELVDDEIQLAYPKSDPELVRILERAIEDARQRQAILAAAMPNRFKGSASGGLVASPRRGGFVREGEENGNLARGAGGAHGSGAGTGQREGVQSRGANQQSQRGDAAGRDGDHRGEQTANKSGQPGGGQRFGSTRNAGGGPGSSALGGMGSLADTRGSDFGLPGKTQGATGITRPIRVFCEVNRLVLAPYRGEPGRLRITPVNGPMRGSIDAFISEVWEHMEGWGIAVAGGYWQPILHVEVASGAESRYAELETLLRDSGLQLRRRSP